jgi:predicted nuclease of predicted toxin-antitoxin system
VKFKLDENFGTRTQNIFSAAGHDVHTVFQESLRGATDQQLYQICQYEHRCLVTLDLDFANVLRFPPNKTNGIVVIRAPQNPSLPVLEQLVRQFCQALETMPIEGKLWVVEVGEYGCINRP